jgi:hypothetical protein
MTGLKWTRKTTRHISQELHKVAISVSHTTVARLLAKLDYRLRVNHKKLAGNKHPQRTEQFEYLAWQRRRCEHTGIPIASVDAKKRELVGNFKNAGALWCLTPELVNDHDFRTAAVGIAILYGVYDLVANCGALSVGTSHDTANFAVDSLTAWWQGEAGTRYAHTNQLLVLADNGGSNGSRVRAWRYALQHKLADPFGLTITVCHYPPGTSKWNPIEHRLFAEISKNWKGQPLRSYETILNFICTTTTETGLRVTATLHEGDYPTGVKISDAEMELLSITPHEVCPQWNYTIHPRADAECEVIS